MSREIRLCENECCYSTQCGLVIDLEDDKFKPNVSHADFICFKDDTIIIIELKNIKDFEKVEDVIKSVKDKMNQSLITKEGVKDPTLAKIKSLYFDRNVKVYFYIVVPKEVKAHFLPLFRGMKAKFDCVDVKVCGR